MQYLGKATVKQKCKNSMTEKKATMTTCISCFSGLTYYAMNAPITGTRNTSDCSQCNWRKLQRTLNCISDLDIWE